MGNHFHVLLETPEPNLVAGMKWMQGVFPKDGTAAVAGAGNVFQGRYKALVVNGEAALVRKRTAIPNRWVASRLGMGHEVGVTRAVRRFLDRPKLEALLKALEKRVEKL